jgi:hypothetical protein
MPALRLIACPTKPPRKLLLGRHFTVAIDTYPAPVPLCTCIRRCLQLDWSRTAIVQPRVVVACPAKTAAPASGLCRVAVSAPAASQSARASDIFINIPVNEIHPVLPILSFSRLSSLSFDSRLNPLSVPLVPQMTLKSRRHINLPRTVPAPNSRDVLITHSW